MPTDLEELKARIEALPPGERLKLAGELLIAGNRKLAHTIAERVVLELGAEMARELLWSEKR